MQYSNHICNFFFKYTIYCVYTLYCAQKTIIFVHWQSVLFVDGQTQPIDIGIDIVTWWQSNIL